MKQLSISLLLLIIIAGCNDTATQQHYIIQPASQIVKAKQFDLSDIRLLDGPFKTAMEKDGEYLLFLEPDRLLAPYLKEAGLKPKAENYGGWENTGLDGHTLGHYLSSLSMIFASTGNKDYKKTADYVVSELAAAQENIGTGYLSGVPGGKEIFEEIASGEIDARPFSLNDSWVPWYNMHKLFAGLRDAYLYADNETAKEVLVKLSEWSVSLSDKLSDEQFNTMIIAEYGGMNEVLTDVYAITGEAKFLEVAQRFNDPRVFPPLANAEDKLAGLHANTQIPKIIGAAREYEFTENDSLHQIATFFWDTVVENRTFANGGNSENEHFGEMGTLDERLTKVTSETCNTFNMLRLTELLMRWNPEEPKYSDYYENALYNHILASQDPKTGMFCYFIPMESGHFKTFSDPEESFWCCVGSGMENHTKYGKNIYMHTQNELYVNLFIASELNWDDMGIKLIQKTNFPQSPNSSLTIETDKPKEFTLKIRRPLWVDNSFYVVVNSDTVSSSDNYLNLDRRWKNGDQIEVHLPMSLRLEPLEDNENLAAVKYGPVLLAGKLGTKGLDKHPIPYAGFDGFDERWDHRRYERMPTVDAPVLNARGRKLNEWLSPFGDTPLIFKTQNAGDPKEVEFAPFYEV
ncbi:MAG: glycoside hydrolase family 127 protein, partial [Gracilimonas sp.]